jgi:hypothetical protein
MGKISSCNDKFMPILTNHASARMGRMGSRRISRDDVAVVMSYGRIYHLRGAVIETRISELCVTEIPGKISL